jgi:beta-lactamase class D
MRKITACLFILGLFCAGLGQQQAIADDLSFILQENGTTLRHEGDCTTPYSPCSSFKIPLGVMGFDNGNLVNEENPELPFEEGYPDYLSVWKNPHTPRLWLKNSCVWFSQVLTGKLGIEKFKDYVERFDYGNKDISGDLNKNNGLTNSWLSSSLEISPEEQIKFLQNLVDNKLPASIESQEMTKKILFLQELENGWQLYGKTGSGSQLNAQRQKMELQHGWFVGWIQKDSRTIVFATHITDHKKQDSYAGPRAKDKAIGLLSEFIQGLENLSGNR